MRAARAFLTSRSGFVASSRSLEGETDWSVGKGALIGGQGDEHDGDLLKRWFSTVAGQHWWMFGVGEGFCGPVAICARIGAEISHADEPRAGGASYPPIPKNLAVYKLPSYNC